MFYYNIDMEDSKNIIIYSYLNYYGNKRNIKFAYFSSFNDKAIIDLLNDINKDIPTFLDRESIKSKERKEININDINDALAYASHVIELKYSFVDIILSDKSKTLTIVFNNIEFKDVPENKINYKSDKFIFEKISNKDYRFLIYYETFYREKGNNVSSLSKVERGVYNYIRTSSKMVSRSDIQSYLGHSDRMISYSLKSLLDKGLIKKFNKSNKEGSNKFNRYIAA